MQRCNENFLDTLTTKQLGKGAILDLFTCSDDVDGYKGTDVGVAIAKKIMEKHNGRVWLESEITCSSIN